jgi:hypothetical protein
MGTGTPSDQTLLSALGTLAREKPAQLIAQLRTFWPQVQQALTAGHTLRLIHQRLNLAGLPISYKVLAVYRGRIAREQKGIRKRRAYPVTDLHAQEMKRAARDYPDGHHDDSKLFKKQEMR